MSVVEKGAVPVVGLTVSPSHVAGGLTVIG